MHVRNSIHKRDQEMNSRWKSLHVFSESLNDKRFLLRYNSNPPINRGNSFIIPDQKFNSIQFNKKMDSM